MYASDHSALKVNIVNLSESVLESRLRAQAMSGAALGDSGPRLVDCLTQLLPTGMELTLQEDVDDASHKERTPIYLRQALGNARSSHGGLNIENRHGEYNRREDASKDRDCGQFCDRREMIPKKTDTSFDENGNAENDSRRKQSSKKKTNGVGGDPQTPSGRDVE